MKLRGCVFLMSLVTLTSVTMGCSGSQEYVRIPVEDARALNTHISAFNNTTAQLIEDSSRQVNTIGALPQGVRAADFELQLVKSALIACFNQPISILELSSETPRGVQASLGTDPLRPLTRRANLANIAFCSPSEMISLESYLQYAPENISSFISQRVLTVDALRVNLKHVLQERLNRLHELAQDGRAEVAQLRETSRQRYESAMSGEGTTPEQRRQSEADYEVVLRELEDIEELISLIERQIDELRRFRRLMVEDVAVNLTAMGLPGS